MKQIASVFKASFVPRYFFAQKIINVPTMGDSITEGDVKEFSKKIGDYVAQDEVVALVETDKVTIDIRCPDAGVITKIYAQQGAKVEVGKPFYEIDTEGKASAAPKAETKAPEVKVEQVKTEAPPAQKSEAASKPATPPPVKAAPSVAPPVKSVTPGSRNEKRVKKSFNKKEPMSRMRQRIAQRLKEAQNTYALLTTFQETDMSAVMEAREALQKDFQKKHNVKLGFMSFFVKASVACLKNQPIVNAVIDGNQIIYRDYIDISVAVATPSGLMVPVLRNCETLGFADIERSLLDLANKGKDGKITPDDMAGGTYTISNGGVFGSMMGTPIINPPQSAILGMHAIIQRPVVRNDQIVAKPMMYLALTYDHRLLDGREAATFLKSLATQIEDPRRLLLEL